MDYSHLSSGGGGPGLEEREYSRRKKIASCVNRRRFLQECLHEQVLPRSAPVQLRNSGKPFSDCARVFLEEGCTNLTNKVYELTDQAHNIPLSQRLVNKLDRENNIQKEKLIRKLKYLCDNSEWKEVGRSDIVLNLSTKQLTETELEALSLGLKFDIGEDKKSYMEYVTRNYRWEDSDANKGFTQGIIACYKALANNQPSALPRRYRKALIDLSKDKDIVITQADKGGGVVVMNRNDYVRKMMDLLNDETTYEKKHVGYATNEAEKFKKNARRILEKSNKGKKLISLLEEAPRPPKMRGQPKTHKVNIPMRPITSGIGSAPHRLAKKLAKPLSNTLGSISGAHLKNSNDLIERLKCIQCDDKKMASFDVKALFTNVPIEGALQAVSRAVDTIKDDELPLPKTDYVKLISLCVRFGAFMFNEEEYTQHRGLAMGSPLSAVMACLYMETLEKDSYNRIIGRGATWYRYVDDIIVIVPKATDIANKLRRLNNVNQDIQFTVEEEEDRKLPFLDTLIWRTEQGLKFSVYRKPTNKNDFIHYLSAHSERTKSGIVIGFFLRAIRICSDEYIEEENRYVVDTFKKLCYPEGLLIKLKRKARNIMEKSRANVERNKEYSRRYITVPNSRKASEVNKYLKQTGIDIATSSGRKIGDVVKGKSNRSLNENSVIYKIPCAKCPAVYYGETGRGMDKRIYEHKADIRHHRTSNALVVHVDRYGHLPCWQQAEVINKGMSKQMRKALEAAHICLGEVINDRSGFVKWAIPAAHLAIKGEDTRQLAARLMVEGNRYTVAGGMVEAREADTRRQTSPGQRQVEGRRPLWNMEEPPG